jgi:cysteine desulfurase/selenocysteine lyase
MNPFHGGGDMIREVHKYETTWNDLPYKFEAGTPNIADVVGFGAAIDYLSNIGMNDNGELNLDDLDKYLATGKVKLVTFSLMSNVLGTISDAETIISKCKAAEVLTLVDGAQAVPHMKVDVEKLGCDFFAFSGHKMLGPTGIGILWVRKSVLETMNPFHGGGDMIREVHKYETTWNDLPYKDVVGFGAAIDYLSNIGMDVIRQHEIDLTSYALDKLSQVKGLHIYGTKDISKRGGVISFNFADVHPHDVAQIIDEEGIAIRSGHHCAQVLMERLNVAATSRASFYIYNTKEEIDTLINSLNKVARIFKL